MAELVRTVVEFTGDTGGFFREMSALYPKEVSRALRHTAYMTSLRLKAEFLAQVPGGKLIPPISRIQQYRILDYYKKNKARGWIRATGLAYNMNGREWPIGGKLAQMIKYRMGIPGSDESLVASIGWFNKDSKTGARFETGQKTRVTNAVRRLFANAGVFLSSKKKVIIQPERPVMKYFFAGRREWMEGILVARIRRNVNKVAAATIRKYAVKTARVLRYG